MVRKSILYLWSQDQMIKISTTKFEGHISWSRFFFLEMVILVKRWWNYFFLQREAIRTKISWSRYVWVIS